MRRCLIAFVICLVAIPAFAATIKFKSGKTVTGKIIEETDKYIVVDSGIGVNLTYYRDELESIDKEGKNLEIGSPDLGERTGGSKKENVLIFSDEIETFRGQVVSLLEKKNFNSLELLAERLRASKEQFSSGNWKLEYFYDNLNKSFGGLNIKSKDQYLEVLRQWKNDKPQSITPLLALVNAYIDLAWQARGTGWGYAVSDEGWERHKAYMRDAQAALSEVSKMGIKDPTYYGMKIIVEYALAPTPILKKTFDAALSSKDEFFGRVPSDLIENREELDAFKKAYKKIFEDGIKFEPLYHPIYFTAANFLLPRWGGAEGEVEEFVEKYSKGSPQEGEGLYALLVRSLFWAGVTTDTWANDFFKRFNFSWPKIQQACLVINKQYAKSSYNLNWCALLACSAAQQEDAKLWFQKITDDWDNDKELVWRRKEVFEKWKDWVNGKIDYPNSRDLHYAVAIGDFEKVKELIEKKKVDPNIRDVLGLTPLMEAVVSSKKCIVASPESLGLNPGEENLDRAGVTAEAPFNGTDDCCKFDSLMSVVNYLIEKGADVNARDIRKYTPLTYAVVSSLPPEDKNPIVKLLIEKGANVNVNYADDWSVLYLTIENGNKELALTLLSSENIDVNKKIVGGWTPLLLSLKRGYKDIALRILDKPDVDVNTNTADGWSALYAAISKGYDEIAQKILEKGDKVDVNVPYTGGWTPLYLSLHDNKLEIAGTLLQRKDIDVNFATSDGWTPLHIAVYNNLPKQVALILAKENINKNPVKGKDKRTPLHIAVEHEYVDIINLLVAHKGIDIEARDARKDTALHMAIKYGKLESVRALLNAGADINARDGYNHNAIEIAEGAGQDRVLKLLREYKKQ